MSARESLFSFLRDARPFVRGRIFRPFKGEFFYEWQVGSFVFQIALDRYRKQFGGRRLRAWRDPLWRRTHG